MHQRHSEASMGGAFARQETAATQADFYSCWSALPATIRSRIEQVADRSSAHATTPVGSSRSEAGLAVLKAMSLAA
jgi:hypothetical protein